MRVYKIYLSIQEAVEGEVSVDDIIITGYEEIDYYLFLDVFLNETATMHDSSGTLERKEKMIGISMKYGGHYCIKKDDTYILDYDFTGSNPVYELLKGKLIIKLRDDKINNVFI